MAEKSFDQMTPQELARSMQAGRVPSDVVISLWRKTHPQLWACAVDDNWRKDLLQPAATAAHPATGQRAAGQLATGRPAPRQIARAIYDENGRLIGAERVFLDRATGEEILPEEPEQTATKPKPKAAASGGDVRRSRKPATEGAVMRMFDTLIAALTETREHANELAQRLEAIESQGYKGVFQHGSTYTKGQEVTDHGARYFCRAESTTARPGASVDWQLTQKTHRKESKE